MGYSYCLSISPIAREIPLWSDEIDFSATEFGILIAFPTSSLRTWGLTWIERGKQTEEKRGNEKSERD